MIVIFIWYKFLKKTNEAWGQVHYYGHGGYAQYYFLRLRRRKNVFFFEAWMPEWGRFNRYTIAFKYYYFAGIFLIEFFEIVIKTLGLIIPYTWYDD